MPFAPIVGINNHTHTIVLGCALLPGETFETFKWVFERWMMAMNQVAPGHIMTDQDQQIGTTISKVFHVSIHRCCFYHVVNLARRKLGPKFGHPFADAFYSCIYGTDTPEQFDIVGSTCCKCTQCLKTSTYRTCGSVGKMGTCLFQTQILTVYIYNWEI
jgi:hypothetical protein